MLGDGVRVSGMGLTIEKKQYFLIPQEKKSYDFSLHLLARIN